MLQRKYKNELQSDKSTIEKSIKRTMDTIERLKDDKHPFNADMMIKRNEESLKKLKNQLSEVEEKLIRINEDSFEDEFKKEIMNTEITIKTKTEISAKKKKNQVKKQENKSYEKDKYVSEFEMAREERRYLKDCASIPDYMIEKLNDMPNNMGYIWRDIWCLGFKSAQNENQLTLFEKKEGIHYVHFYDKKKSMYYLYEKDSMGKKNLIKCRSLNNLS